MDKGKLTRMDTWRLGWLATLMAGIAALGALAAAGLPLTAVFVAADLLGHGIADRTQDQLLIGGSALLFPYVFGMTMEQIGKYRSELQRGDYR